MSSILHGTTIQPKPPSPASPSFQDKDKQSSAQRSFIDLTNTTGGSIRNSAMLACLVPPPGMLFADYIRGWTDADVAKWLAEIKCDRNAETFKNNDIRGDILLELDQGTLKEMGVASIGDRLRIVNAVKVLRQKATFKMPVIPVVENNSASQPSSAFSESSPATRLTTRKLESGRPAPLQLPPSTGRPDLPRLVREQSMPDSAKGAPSRYFPPTTPSAATPVSSHTPRPQLPPVPRTQASIPPPSNRGPSRMNGRRTPTPTEPPALTFQPLPPAPAQVNLQAPTNSSRPTFHLPSDPRPGSAGGRPPPRTPSPNHSVPPPRTISRQANTNTSHIRTYSGPNPKTGPHPYATASASLQPPSQTSINLSPIAENFTSQTQSSPPSPPVLPSSANVNRSSPSANSSVNPSLDDLRKYIVKFVLPEEGHSWKISIQDCAGGVEILEKVLKKLDKGGTKSPDNENHERVLLDGGGLSVDGWSVYLDRDGHGPPLTEAELLSICHSPNHSAREQGLTLRKTARARPYGARNYLEPGARNTKRASSLSILAELGVRDPERALEPPSPTGSTMTGTTSSHHAAKKPSKLRNFFGQRPPSELITNHLTEYFPYTEKKVLERTARNSMMRTNSQSGGRRDSIASSAHLPSRFSISTQGSVGGISEPRASISSNISNAPSTTDTDSNSAIVSVDEIPRVSLSTEDGRSVELKSPVSPHLLPPIPFPTESLSQTLNDFANKSRRTPSVSSRRTSYMKELRSKKDRSDTASLMTVDQITAEVESRRESLAIDRMGIDSNSNEEIDEWTKVDSDDDLAGSTLHEDGEVELEVAVAPEDPDVDEESEDYSDDLDDLDEETDAGEEEDEGDDGIRKATTSGGRKWIKGALIGSGSFGQVYLGMDASTGLLMAVKQVELPTGSAPNEERKKQMLSALEREIELLKDLQHDNIVQYLYSSLDDDYLNIFLEYVPGGSVTALLRNYGAFEEPLVKNFVRQILVGLQYLHERDIIHRDIKGANILVDNKGGIKISDFGISKKVETNLMMNKRVSLQGSVFWMPPEVIKQTEHTNRADIWSVGCLVVEMLTGEHPFAHLSQMQAIFKIGSCAKPDIPSDISSEAQEFLSKTFEIKPENRPSAAELLQHPWMALKQPKAKPSEVTG